ncbi:MAG: hypothetical protein R3B06_29255 [Kofleriaceae bacterium]
MRSLRSLALALLVPIAACGHNASPGHAESAPGAAATPAAPAPIAPAAAAPTRGADKPTAPVGLAVSARSLGVTGDVERFEITLTATPERAVTHVDLAIDGRVAQGAAVAAPAVGVPMITTAVVDLPRGEGRDVIGTATVMVDGRRMTRAADVRIGAAAPTVTGTIIHLPDGTAVQEVRP